MTLDELKLAAKRLRKQGPELFGPSASQISQAKALEMAARLHGFRDYHEAHQRLTQRCALDELLKEPGGLLATHGVSFDLSELVLSTNGTLQVQGASGTGKSMLCNELVVQALAKSRRVRIIDCGGSYRRLTQMLGGEHSWGVPTEASYAAWAGDAMLVALDAEGAEEASRFDFERLRDVPADALVLCDESWLFRHGYHLLNGRTNVLVGQAAQDFPGQSAHRLVFSAKTGSELRWQWQVDGRHIELRLHVGPRRLAFYSTRPEHVLAMGRAPGADQIDAFVATLKPAFTSSQSIR